MKISKKTRQDASLILAVKASSTDRFTLSNWYTADGLGTSVEAEQLAWAAFCLVSDHQVETGDNDFRRVLNAEAEALLQEGWTP